MRSPRNPVRFNLRARPEGPAPLAGCLIDRMRHPVPAADDDGTVQGEIRWHGVQDDPRTVELRASLPTLPAGERHILVHDADRRRRVGSAVRLRPLAAQTAHPRCPWVTPPVAVSDPNSFEDGALGPLESDAERGMERGEQEPMNALIFIFINDLQDIHIGNRGSRASGDCRKTSTPATSHSGTVSRSSSRRSSVSPSACSTLKTA